MNDSGTSPPSVEVTSEELARLAWKYRTLAELREAKAREGSTPPRPVFRALAAEFPGALNELDMLPMATIEERAAALERASAASGEIAPWMRWLHAYHAIFRGALRVKRALAAGNKKRPSGEGLGPLAASAAETAKLPFDEDLVRAVANPPEGRIARVVYEELARRFGIPAATIAEALFPHRRAGLRR